MEIKNKDDFLKWEATTRDCIDVKKVYIDIAGDLVAGILLNQIVSCYKKNNSLVERNNSLWLVKKRTDWWEECRITPKQFDRAIRILKDKKLVETAIFKFNGEPTTHIKINWENFFELLQAQVKGNSNLPNGEIPNFPKGEFQIDQKGNSSNIGYNIDYNRDYKNNNCTNKSSQIKSEPTTLTPQQRYFKQVKEFFDNPPQDWLKEMEDSYPSLNVREELKKMKAWLLSNYPSHIKKNFKRFANNWLSKQVDEVKRKLAKFNSDPIAREAYERWLKMRPEVRECVPLSKYIEKYREGKIKKKEETGKNPLEGVDIL